MEKTFVFDLSRRGIFTVDGTAATLTELLTGCDKSQLCILAGTFDGKDFAPINLAGYQIDLGFARKGTYPQKGTWSATVGADTTQSLAFNVTVKAFESYLNELQSVIDAGGLTVRPSSCSGEEVKAATGACVCVEGAGNSALGVDICWNTVGDKPQLSIDSACLYPNFVTNISTVRQGTATCTEIQQVRFAEEVLAYQGAWVAKAASTINVTRLQAGGGTKNEIQRVAITPAPVGGTFCVNIAGCQSDPISVFATADEFQAALGCSEDYTISKSGAYQWDVTYINDTAAHSLLTIACDSIRNGGGVTGEFILDTTRVRAMLNGCECVDGILELKLTENGGGASCRYTEEFQVCRNIIDDSNPASPVPVPAAPLTSIATSPTGIGSGTALDPLRVLYCIDVAIPNGVSTLDLATTPASAMVEYCGVTMVNPDGEPYINASFSNAAGVVRFDATTLTGNYELRVLGRN